MQFHDPLLASLVTAAYFLIALWKLSLVVQIYLHGPVKQAKKYSMTASITAKINALIYVYTAYVFYEAIMAAFQQPDASQYKLILDLVIKVSFALMAVSIFGSMLAELNKNAGLGGAESHKVRFLLRALNRRNMYMVEFLIVMPVLAFLKYQTNGLWVPMLQSIGVPTS